MKGVVKGSLWGLMLGGAGLSFASLVSEQPQYAQGPAAPQISVPDLDQVAPETVIALPVNVDEAPQLVPSTALEDVSDNVEAAPEVSTDSADQPQLANVAKAITAPDAPKIADFAQVSDAPILPRLETTLGVPTAEETAPAVDTVPAAALPAPVIEDAPNESTTPEVIVIEVPDEPIVDESAPLIVILEPEQDVASEIASADAENAPILESGTPSIAPEIIVIEVPAPEADPVVVETPPSPEVAAVEEAVPVEQETAVIVAPAPVEVVPAPVVEEAPAAQEQAVVITEVLPQTTAAVRINRLPQTDDTLEAEATDTPAAVEIPDDLPALQRYAAPFEQANAPALISIVLIDDGQMSDAPNAVADLGFVPTVAVNALSSASTDLAAAYRAAGIEVAMQAGLSEDATPTDVEVAFEAARGLVPEVVMLFSDGSGALQNRAATTQIMEILSADGYGFVGVQRGLSNAARAAEQADVPAATILRDIDGGGEDARAIARALDQAAVRARQSGAAVLLGRMTPDTLAALKIWAADLDQETLAIAPASAILLRDE